MPKVMENITHFKPDAKRDRTGTRIGPDTGRETGRRHNNTRIGHETGRCKHYAQRCFVTAGAVDRADVRPDRSQFLNFIKTKQNSNMETLKLHCKYVDRLAGRDFVNASPLAQIELRRNMPRTSGESTNVEADIKNCVKSFEICVIYGRHALKPTVL